MRRIYFADQLQSKSLVASIYQQVELLRTFLNPSNRVFVWFGLFMTTSLVRFNFYVHLLPFSSGLVWLYPKCGF